MTREERKKRLVEELAKIQREEQVEAQKVWEDRKTKILAAVPYLIPLVRQCKHNKNGYFKTGCSYCSLELASKPGNEWNDSEDIRIEVDTR